MKKSYIFPAVMILLALGWFVGKPLYMKPAYDRGEMAPNFSGKTLGGKDFDLASLRGSYVVIDFWGSWCPPCRYESPLLVEFYKQHKGQKFKGAEGLKMVSVGIERDAKRWQSAIKKDGLSWENHLMDSATNFRFINSPIAESYGVKEVPTKFLLNPKGEIIGVNLSFQEMSDILTGQNGKN